ncbi:hypothetical protein LTR08_006708 [Meristemomyces frigidus]|nr:hypothetical protein LTR08_006708 [Meristemomyces frigidus]
MADDSTATTPSPTRNRRSSFAGQTFADLFSAGRSNTQRSSMDNGASNSPPNYPGPITQAAAQAHARRVSVTTMQPYRGLRRDSIGSATSGSIDESAIEDDVAPRDPITGSAPTTPFGIGRRMSFGAKALRDVRNLSGSGASGSATQNGTRSPSASHSANAKAQKQNGTTSSRDAKGRGLSLPVPNRYRGFSLSLQDKYSLLTDVSPTGSAEFWNENMRTRAERTSSFGGQNSGSMPVPIPSAHSRTKSVATMEQPVQEMPVPKMHRRPDAFQEKILFQPDFN